MDIMQHIRIKPEIVARKKKGSVDKEGGCGCGSAEKKEGGGGLAEGITAVAGIATDMLAEKQKRKAEARLAVEEANKAQLERVKRTEFEYSGGLLYKKGSKIVKDK